MAAGSTPANDSNGSPAGVTLTTANDETIDFGYYKVTDLAITKTDGTTTYTPGGSTTYTIVVSNNGPVAVTGAPVVDNLPAAITSDTWTAVAIRGASVAQPAARATSTPPSAWSPAPPSPSPSSAHISASAGSTATLADFSTLGANNTALPQNVTVNSVRADAFYVSSLNSTTYLTTNTTLYERNGGTPTTASASSPTARSPRRAATSTRSATSSTRTWSG